LFWTPKFKWGFFVRFGSVLLAAQGGKRESGRDAQHYQTGRKRAATASGKSRKIINDGQIDLV
jgi:hypothetical protein